MRSDNHIEVVRRAQLVQDRVAMCFALAAFLFAIFIFSFLFSTMFDVTIEVRRDARYQAEAEE